MEAEHCLKSGWDISFKTSNYGITTTPKDEWKFVVEMQSSNADMRHGRRVLNIEELSESETALTARLTRVELVAVVLYTGPMVIALTFNM